MLYFYPKDDTPGCTKEACTFRDQYEDFTAAGAEVIGVSSDSSESHRKFAGKYSLPFTLLSDRGGEVRKRYGVPATLGLLPGRVTFVIDAGGRRAARLQLASQGRRSTSRKRWRPCERPRRQPVGGAGRGLDQATR